jgi:hypothetical protein
MLIREIGEQIHYIIYNIYKTNMRGPAIFSILGAFIMVGSVSAKADAAAGAKKDVSISCLIYDDLSFYDLRAI